MKVLLEELVVVADEEFQLIKITNKIREKVAESEINEGIVHVITEHTTTGITVNESLPCVERDILGRLDSIFPDDYPYEHNHYLPSYGTIGANAPGHLKSLITGNHCVFPIVAGQLKLGHAADIYFEEYDGIKKRKIMIHMMGV